MTDTFRAEAPPAETRDGRVDIVTVNWNAGAQLAECVESVRAEDGAIVRRFIVVDNGSLDGSADLATDWPKLLVDKTDANLGFGRACNRGAAQGDAPYLLFLNPDTRLTEPAISKAVAFLESEAGAAYSGCGIKLIDETGHATRHCARFPGLVTFASIALGIDKLLPSIAPSLLMTDFDHLSSRPVDHVQGAFYLIRREVFDRAGGFDPDYFVYFEDLDLSLRARRLGRGLYYLAEASAFHRGAGTSGQVKSLARFYGIEARLLYARKHFSGPSRILNAALVYTMEPLATMTWHLVKYRGRSLSALLATFRLLLRHTPGVLRGTTARERGARAEQRGTNSAGPQRVSMRGS